MTQNFLKFLSRKDKSKKMLNLKQKLLVKLAKVLNEIEPRRSKRAKTETRFRSNFVTSFFS